MSGIGIPKSDKRTVGGFEGSPQSVPLRGEVDLETLGVLTEIARTPLINRIPDDDSSAEETTGEPAVIVADAQGCDG